MLCCVNVFTCMFVYPFADFRSLSPGYFTLTYSRNLASGFVLFLFFFTSTLINYLAMKIPCLLFFLQQLVCFFFQQNSLLYYSLFRLQFIVHLLLLSLFDIFDSILICFISLILIMFFHMFSGSLRQFIIVRLLTLTYKNTV